MIKIRKLFILSIIVFTLIFACLPTFAHPGALDEHGGHWDRSNNTYHYHDGKNTTGGGSSSSTENSNGNSEPPKEIIVYKTPVWAYWVIAIGAVILAFTIWVVYDTIKCNDNKIRNAESSLKNKETECINTVNEYNQKLNDLEKTVYEKFKTDFDNLAIQKATQYPFIAAYYVDYAKAFYYKIADSLNIKHHYSPSTYCELKRMIDAACNNAIKSNHECKIQLDYIYKCFPELKEIIFSDDSVVKFQKVKTIISEELLTSFTESLDAVEHINNKLESLNIQYSEKTSAIQTLEVEINNKRTELDSLAKHESELNSEIDSMQKFELHS